MSNQISVEDKKLSKEIIRFLITGCICALLDFLVCYLVNALFKNIITIEPILVALYTLCGFIVGVLANYLLSNLWVFKNVEDKSKQKTPKFISSIRFFTTSRAAIFSATNKTDLPLYIALTIILTIV